MNRRDIVIGFIVLIILGIGVLSLRGSQNQVPKLPSSTPISNEQKIESNFKVNIPDDMEKVELKDVSGSNNIAIATRKFENGKFTLTILADLNDPFSGSFFQAWIAKDADQERSKYLSLGKLIIAKGGWILEYQSKTNYMDYKNVLITQETKTDSVFEKKILEGSF